MNFAFIAEQFGCAEFDCFGKIFGIFGGKIQFQIIARVV